ncbi:LRP2-like protein, partial [Mya arenaria]
VFHTSGPIEDLAVDWIGENLYWTDTNLETVNVGSLSRLVRMTLFSTNVSSPKGIAVDPSDRLLFWVDTGSELRIERAGLDGSDRVAIITTDIHYPTKEADFLVVAYQKGIAMYNITGSFRYQLPMFPSSNMKNVVSIASNDIKKELLVIQSSDDKNQSVTRVDVVQGNSSSYSEHTFIGKPSSVAYDSVTGNLWMTKTDEGTIVVSRRDSDGKTTYMKVVLNNMGRNTDCVAPTAIAINTRVG